MDFKGLAYSLSTGAPMLVNKECKCGLMVEAHWPCRECEKPLCDMQGMVCDSCARSFCVEHENRTVKRVHGVSICNQCQPPCLDWQGGACAGCVKEYEG
jgi:hypothetical protein